MLSVTSNNGKRLDYISWDEYFMGMTLLNGDKYFHNEVSKTKSAILLNKRKIIIGTAHKHLENNETDHVAKCAINDAKSRHHSVSESILYTLNFPCEKCAQILINSGVCEIVYFHADLMCEKALEIFKSNNVMIRQFIMDHKKIAFDFSQFS